MTEQPFTVVVSAGTYHLPFDRLIDWMAAWWADHPDVRLIVQHGVSRTLDGAENHTMLPPAGLLELYRTAGAIVLQGGAGGVMDAREALRKPIVVPRVPGGGEVVDGHQIEFAQRLAALDVVYLADTQQRLADLLDEALAGTLNTLVASLEPTPGAANAMQRLQLLPAPLPTRARWARLRLSVRRLASRR